MYDLSNPNANLAIMPFHARRSDILAEGFIGFATIRQHRVRGKNPRSSVATAKAAPGRDTRHPARLRPGVLCTRFLVF